MCRSPLCLVGLALLSSLAVAEEHKVGPEEKFPKSVKVGDTVTFKRPAFDTEVVVKVNGKEIKGTKVRPVGEGFGPIVQAKWEYEIKAEKAGKLEVEIVITTKDKKGDKKESYTVEVK